MNTVTVIKERPGKLLDALLFGDETLERCEPDVNDDCLAFDGQLYWEALVTHVFPESRTFHVSLPDKGTVLENIPFHRFRPLVR